MTVSLLLVLFLFYSKKPAILWNTSVMSLHQIGPTLMTHYCYLVVYTHALSQHSYNMTNDEETVCHPPDKNYDKAPNNATYLPH